MSNKQAKRNLRIYEAVSYEAALEASDHPDDELTPAELAWVHRVADNMQERVAAKLRADREAKMKSRVRPSIFAMARDAVEEWISALVEENPDMVLAHRDLTEMSDDDLRTALEDALTLLERQH